MGESLGLLRKTPEELIMCTPIVEIIEAEGAGKGGEEPGRFGVADERADLSHIESPGGQGTADGGPPLAAHTGGPEERDGVESH